MTDKEREKRKNKRKRFLALLRRHNSEIDEICSDWERAQKRKKKLVNTEINIDEDPKNANWLHNRKNT